MFFFFFFFTSIPNPFLFFLFLTIKINLFYLSALPPDTPLADLGALAAYDLSKLPDARKSGEDIIREIQQELLTRVGSAESAVIPEQDAQRLMVGVSTCTIVIHISNFLLPLHVHITFYSN